MLPMHRAAGVENHALTDFSRTLASLDVHATCSFPYFQKAPKQAKGATREKPRQKPSKKYCGEDCRQGAFLCAPGPELFLESDRRSHHGN